MSERDGKKGMRKEEKEMEVGWRNRRWSKQRGR